MLTNSPFHAQTDSFFVCATPWSAPNHRGATRFAVKWKVVAFVDEHNMFHGHTKDVSASGATILLPVNMARVKLLDLHFHVPATHPESRSHMLHVVGKLVYMVYDSVSKSFRAGVEFQEFKSGHSADFLADHLTRNHHPLSQ